MSKYLKWYPYDSGKYTNRLFLELCIVDELDTSIVKPLYTLAHDDYTDADGNTYLSLRKRYLELKDPSESAIAEIYFYDHRHWDKIVETTALAPYVAEWRISLERILQEDAIENIKKIASQGNFAAAKWLAEKQWKTGLDERSTLNKKKTKKVTLPAAEKAEVSDDARRVLAFIKPRSAS